MRVFGNSFDCKVKLFSFSPIYSLIPVTQAPRRFVRHKAVSTSMLSTPTGCGAVWSAGRGWRSSCTRWRRTTPRRRGKGAIYWAVVLQAIPNQVTLQYIKICPEDNSKYEIFFLSVEGATVQQHSLTIWVPCRSLLSTQLPSTTDLHLQPLRFGPTTPSRASWSAGALRCHGHHPTCRRQALCCSLTRERSLVSGNNRIGAM